LAKIAKAKAGARGSKDNATTSGTASTGKRGGGYATSRTAKALAQKQLDASDAAKQKQIESNSTVSGSSKKRRRDSSNAGDDTQQSIVTEMLEASEDSEDDEELEAEDDSEEEDDDDQPLVHETLLLQNGNASTSSASLQPRAKKAAKYAGESKADKDARTTFIGNVPVACATNKVSWIKYDFFIEVFS